MIRMLGARLGPVTPNHVEAICALDDAGLEELVVASFEIADQAGLDRWLEQKHSG